jgi:hypothetical protein
MLGSRLIALALGLSLLDAHSQSMNWELGAKDTGKDSNNFSPIIKFRPNINIILTSPENGWSTVSGANYNLQNANFTHTINPSLVFTQYTYVYQNGSWQPQFVNLSGNVTITFYKNGALQTTKTVPWTCVGILNYVAGGSTAMIDYGTGPFNVYFNPSTMNISMVDPNAEPDYESGIFMFQNITGQDQEMQFGDEVLKLKPGMNSIPYHSKLDGSGFPVDLPIGFDGVKKLDGDGKPYIVATLRNGIEYSTEWSPMTPSLIDIFPPTATAGPTVRAPGANGSPVYNQLPAGMSPSMGNPLPGGMTIGTVGLPRGMTPGVNGALPSGVASGGSGSLPSGVSPGVFPNPFPNGQTLPPSGIRPPGTRTTDPGVVPGTPSNPPPPPPPTGTTGGTSVAGGSVIQTGENNQEPGGVYGEGSNMAGAGDAATALGEAGANEVSGAMSNALDGIGQAVANPLGENNGKFWTAPGAGAFEAYDTSWMNFSINNIPHFGTISVEIPPHWISLVRQILLWVIRIYFVFGCIKLLMK